MVGNKIKIIFLMLVLVFMASYLSANSSLKKGLENLADDLGELSHPGNKLSNKEKLSYSGLALTSVALLYKYDLYLEDKLLYHHQNKFKNPFLHALSRPAYWYGNNARNVFYTWSMLTTGLVGAGFFTGKNEHYKSAQLLSESFLFSTLITGITKIALGRERPGYPGSKARFQFFELQTKYRSMPSGHTTAAFTFATVIAERYDDLYVKVPVYTLAICAGLERIEHRHHWLSDVIIGGMLGYYIGQTVVKIHSEKDKSQININKFKKDDLLIKFSIPF
ncbi:MAG: phosphatase PAP2 family protein [Candidatus Marinimicrobia bacterium]|nr:phosphatase PAP2 family protein [Candidatus Neomarinimicrobiota bacterium]